MVSPESSAGAARPAPPFREFVALIAALMSMTALTIDIMLPALPAIGSGFGVADPNAPQLVVTVYVLGFAAGQLLYGPMSDSFGRRPVLLAGLAAYAAAAFACTIADSFAMLLAARFAQGIAVAAPRVTALAVVRDVYSGRRMAEVMSFVMMVFIIVPVIAPSIGGAWLLVADWPAIFAFLGAFALVLLGWAGWRLPETRAAAHRVPLSFGAVGNAFLAVVRTRVTLGYTLATGVLFGALMGYVNSAQQVFVDIYGLGVWFPAMFGAVSLAIAAASFANSRLVVRLGMRRLSHAALTGFVATSVVHLAIVLAIGTPPLALFAGLLWLAFFFFGFLMPNLNALAMEPMGRIAGTASSFIGATTTGTAAVLGWAVGQHFAGSVVPLLAGFAVFGAVSLALVAVTERGRLFADPGGGAPGH